MPDHPSRAVMISQPPSPLLNLKRHPHHPCQPPEGTLKPLLRRCTHHASALSGACLQARWTRKEERRRRRRRSSLSLLHSHYFTTQHRTVKEAKQCGCCQPWMTCLSGSESAMHNLAIMHMLPCSPRINHGGEKVVLPFPLFLFPTPSPTVPYRQPCSSSPCNPLVCAD